MNCTWSARGRISAALAAALLVGIAARSAAAPIRAFVTILPEAQFVERVGGANVAVDVLVGPGQSPHAYEPRPRQVAAIEAARVYFRIGLPVEDALLAKARAANPALTIVDLRAGVVLLPAAEGEEHEGRLDPHVWMDPRRVKTMAGTIASALSTIDPEHAADYAAGARAFRRELDALDARVAAALAPVRGKDLLVFHPAFGYFADVYGLHQAAVETGGKEPGPKRLAALIARVRASGARVIFVQPQYPRRSAEAIATETGAAVVVLDTLARDYVGNLAAVAEAIRKGLAETPP